METLKKLAVPLVLVLLVIGLAVVVFGGDDDEKTVTAYFPRTVSLYEGSDVRVLGVPVGRVDTVTPVGTQVKVVMHYDRDVKVPDTARALLVSPAIVGDRYVQLTPAFADGDKELADKAVLRNEELADGSTRNGVPLELDEIYASLDKLTVALGPDGANSQGALSDLLAVTAKNFGGQGENFHRTITNFSKLSQTLDDNKEELFGSTRELSKFIKKLADNDDVVRDFTRSLGKVSTELAGERKILATSLKNLGVALTEVGKFVKDNRGELGADIKGLNRVLDVVVKRRDALDQILRIAPVALNNELLTYNPDTGTLDNNANIDQLVNNITKHPAGVLCALINGSDPKGKLCDAISKLLPRTVPFGPGSGTSYAPYDPTLGGLVGGAR